MFVGSLLVGKSAIRFRNNQPCARLLPVHLFSGIADDVGPTKSLGHAGCHLLVGLLFPLINAMSVSSSSPTSMVGRGVLTATLTVPARVLLLMFLGEGVCTLFGFDSMARCWCSWFLQVPCW